MFTIFDGMSGLVESFERDVRTALELESPNEADVLLIKTAIVGFTYHASIEDWCLSDLEFVRRRVESEWPGEELEHYGQNAENLRLFFSLCIGYLLGLFRSEQIDETEFRTAEAQIPGLTMLNLERLTTSKLDA
jgi:hypothetical protein